MNIALVAHDGRKNELMEWVRYNYKTLSEHNIFATGTTGKLIEQMLVAVDEEGGRWDVDSVSADGNETGMCPRGAKGPLATFPFAGKVTRLLSGPLGGDQQIGAMIAEGKIDMLIFFCDNLIVQGHQNDVSALTRLAALYNIAFATNRTTADMLLTSPLMNDTEYRRVVPAVIESYANRKLA